MIVNESSVFKPLKFYCTYLALPSVHHMSVSTAHPCSSEGKQHMGPSGLPLWLGNEIQGL